MTSFEVTAEEIADKEIGLWKLRTVPLPKTDDPLMEWKLCGDKNVCPFLGRLARRVLAVPATSASPERLFSTAGNEMTKKRCRLTCDNLETSFTCTRSSCSLPVPLPLLITLPLSPSLAQGQTLTVSIPQHTPSHAGHRYR